MANKAIAAFKTDSLLRSLVILNIIAFTYCILINIFDFVDNEKMQEVLKQILTFTALVVTIIYALLIPRVFFERDKKDKLNDSLRSYFQKIFLMQSFCSSLSEVIHIWDVLIMHESRSAWHDISSIARVNNLYGKEFVKAIEEAIGANEQPDSVIIAKIYNIIRSHYQNENKKKFSYYKHIFLKLLFRLTILCLSIMQNIK